MREERDEMWFEEKILFETKHRPKLREYIRGLKCAVILALSRRDNEMAVKRNRERERVKRWNGSKKFDFRLDVVF